MLTLFYEKRERSIGRLVGDAFRAEARRHPPGCAGMVTLEGRVEDEPAAMVSLTTWTRTMTVESVV